MKKVVLLTFLLVLITGSLITGFWVKQNTVLAATLFSDDFEDGNSTGWTVVNGGWSVVTDGTKVFKQANTSGEASVYAGTSTWTNYTVEAKIKLYNNANGTASGIIARYVNSSNYYMFRLHSNDSKVELYKKVGGTFTKITDVAMTISTNTWYTLKLVLNGSSLTGYVDGVQKVSATDTSFTSGCIGARTYAQSVAIDDVIVTDSSSATATPTLTPTTTPTATPGNTPTPTPTAGSSTIIDNGQAGYSETGTWLDSSLLGYNGSTTRYSQTIGSTASWTLTAPQTGNYNIYVWYPYHSNSSTNAEYKITTVSSSYFFTVNQTQNAGLWNKLATVYADGGTGITVMVSTKATNTRADAAKFELTTSPTTTPLPTPATTATPTPAGSALFVNQSGYDLNKPKRFTAPGIADGTSFNVKKGTTVVYTGTVNGNIGDFSGFNPATDPGEYYIECAGKTSVNFSIGPYWMQRVSVEDAMQFMIQSRSDTFCWGTAGVGWRDSHQFSFEMNSLALMYMSNPALFERLPYTVNASGCEYPELQTQTEPDIIWLMKFAAKRYWDKKTVEGYNLHEMTKAQLAYFLYIYPEISQWVSSSFYQQIRDFAIQEWSNINCNLSWYDISGHDHDLFKTKTVIGTGKGSYPPGHSIIPNLMMYEVLKRDGLSGYQSYFDAAYNNCQWVINNVDWNDPATTKGQRMSEHITLEALVYFQEIYPTLAPAGLLNKINFWADVMIARSGNLWDFRKYDDPADGSGTGNTWIIPSYNEPGNVAGFMAPAYAARRVMTDQTKKNRLQEIAIGQIDHTFGRNPFGRHFCHDAQVFEGVETGWFSEYSGGNGVLGNVPAVLDASPKEASYPYNPSADPGYVEGWVAFNTAWNCSLAYSAAEELEVKVYNSGFTSEISSAAKGSTIGIQLRAPLNFNYGAAETGKVVVTDSSGNKSKVTVTEKSNNDFYFQATYTVPTTGSWIDVSYGYGIFKKTKRITLN